MNRLYVIAAAAIGIMSLLAAFLPATPSDQAAPPVVAKKAGAKAKDDQILTLTRDGSGQFTLRGMINGSEVEFLVDTGADLVALTEAEADALGIMPADEDFLPTVQTASGVGYGAPVTIDELEVGGQVLRDVDAMVVKDLATNLLGQSALRRFGSVELQGDKMTIRPK
ncbi:MAG: TIGR02281 family clan AA aspartic protease [Sphingomonadales bacterium]|nr:TIGR02281 family clan AA aspartic protease [Sphingomonadales bacterium]